MVYFNWKGANTDNKSIPHNMNTSYLNGAIKQFEYYKLLGEKAMQQIPDEKLFWQYNAESNSVAVIVKHLHGNMMSRWTDFLNSDGEKEWRNRDGEFENDISTKEDVDKLWNLGWEVFLTTLHALNENDLGRTVYIRNQGHSVLEAINRQLAHYPYHIGQIIFIGKMCCDSWNSLSIPKGNSEKFNANKFSQDKGIAHFTDEYINSGKIETSVVIKNLREAHEKLWLECSRIPEDIRNKRINNKWSAVQHVQHISKGSGAFYKYLNMEKVVIEKTFGLSDRNSMSYNELLNKYNSMLAQGAVSTDRFNPDSIETISLNTERDKGAHIVEGIVAALENWSESDLDKYFCPHPNLGDLTVREMLYFTVLHAEHHTKSILQLGDMKE